MAMEECISISRSAFDYVCQRLGEEECPQEAGFDVTSIECDVRFVCKDEDGEDEFGCSLQWGNCTICWVQCLKTGLKLKEVEE